MTWKTSDLIFFMFVSFMMGTAVQALYELSDRNPRRIKEKEKIQTVKTIYCSLGKIETIQHFLDTSKPFPTCDFTEEK